jgi:hypothetical protein
MTTKGENSMIMTDLEAVKLSLEQWKKIKEYLEQTVQSPGVTDNIHVFKNNFVTSTTYPIPLFGCYLCSIHHPFSVGISNSCIDCPVQWTRSKTNHYDICEKEDSPYLTFSNGYTNRWIKGYDWKSGRKQMLKGASGVIKKLEETLERLEKEQVQS